MKAIKLTLPIFGLAAFTVGTPAAQAITVLTFDNIPEGTVASNQYSGLLLTGGSVLTQDSRLSPAFPALSDPNVLFNYLNDNIRADFFTSVDSIGAYVTGNGSVTLSAFNGATLLGTVSTPGSNYIGSGGGAPNLFLNLAFPGITSAVFRSEIDSFNTFTIDNLTIGGDVTTNTGVPEPTTWALLMVGFGFVAMSMRQKHRQKVRYNFA